MARATGNKPELPAEAYQYAEMYGLGQPSKMYRANVNDGVGCALLVLGFVVVLVPLGGFFYQDYTLTPTLLRATGYSIVAFLLIAFIMLLPGFLARHVRVYLCSNGLIYIYKQSSKRRVVFWNQIIRVDSPSHKVSHRHSRLWIAVDLFFGPGDGALGRSGGSTFDYCIIYLEEGSNISFSQAIKNLSGLAKDIRGYLRSEKQP